MALGLDHYLGARYQACALNYCAYIKQLFGERHSLDQFLSYSLQFSEISRQQAEGIDVADGVPALLKSFILEFDKSLTPEEFNSPRFAYRLKLERRTVNRPGQADAVVEFVPLGSETEGLDSDRFIVVKDVEKPKYRMKDILSIVRSEGYPKFNSFHHTTLWKASDAKNPSKGFGTMVGGTWYWYESWLKYVRLHCDASEGLYR
jgi:hypothetical protein